jgi:hypothetical protein
MDEPPNLAVNRLANSIAKRRCLQAGYLGHVRGRRLTEDRHNQKVGRCKFEA